MLVIAKEEEAWWKGECGGKTGVFPSNYVEPAKCKYPAFLCSPGGVLLNISVQPSVPLNFVL